MTKKNNVVTRKTRHLPAQSEKPPFALNALSALTLIALTQAFPVQAACVPTGTAGNDTIVCSSSTTGAVSARDGDDSVTVNSGATVNNGAPGTIDAGAGNDTVTNQGTVSTSQTVSQTLPPPWPSLNIVGTTTAENIIGTEATAVTGGADNDTITNSGTVRATTNVDLTTITAPVSINGGQIVNLTNTITSTATAIDGGTGVDAIATTGQVITEANSELDAMNFEHNFVDASHGFTTTEVTATATGIKTGDGAGSTTTISGSVEAEVSADSANTNLEFNLIDAATAHVSLTVEATATGVNAGNGTITNNGSIDAYADSESTDVSINASYLDITISDRTMGSSGTEAKANAASIDGTDAADGLTINNAGNLHSQAEAFAHAVAVSLASEGAPQATEPVLENPFAGIASVGITATSNASGVIGGANNDTVTNSGAISVDAESDARQISANLGVSLIDWKIPTPGIVIGSAGTKADSTATGLDGGAGNDTITNNQTVVTNADSDSEAVTVSVNISGFTDNTLGGGSIPGLGNLSASLVVADTVAEASATSTGITGGEGADTIDNNASITSSSSTQTGSIGAAATVNMQHQKGQNVFSVNAVGARVGTVAESTSTGIDGGANNDTMTNDNTIVSHAETEALAVSASLVVAGTARGAGGSASVALTDSSAVANATGIGMQGGDGDDSVTNNGTITAGAEADALSISASLNVNYSRQGLSAGLSLADAEAEANATAVGIAGGVGADTLTNAGTINAAADANSIAVAVSVTVSGTADGLSAGGALTDGSGDATASAIGIDGGDGNDILTNSNVINVSGINADSLAASVAVQTSGTNNGLAIGVSMADASANATANVSALEGGAGDDQITNTRAITLQNITADADAISVSASLNGALNAGVAAGAAIADSSTNANIDVKLISGGAGNDAILNTGAITATNNILADSTATSVAVSGNISMAGIALSAALTDASANASTELTAIHGGAGDDTIDNRAQINLSGRANVQTVGVSVAIGAALGIGGSAAIVDASSHADSTVIGIDGGTGRNDITNRGNLDVRSDSDADAFTLGLNATLAFGADLTLVDATANANATAVGINDTGSAMAPGVFGRITNTHSIRVDADTNVDGKAISGQLRGYSLGETTITATSDGYGVRSDEGSTLIQNSGGITVDSHADAYGLSVAVTLAGKAMGNANAVSESRGTGIAAGADADVVQHTGNMNVTAQAYTDALAIAVDLAGTARTDAKTQALTTAVGVDGGSGDDQVGSTGPMTINAFSSTDAENVQVSIVGTTGSDTLNTPISNAIAITGGAGDDQLSLNGGANSYVRLRSDADAAVTDSSWTIAGAGGARAGVDTQAYATALDGGAGNDSLFNASTLLEVEATGYAYVSSSSFTFAGTAGTEAAMQARSRAAGMDGGDGNDTLRNENNFSVTGRATLEAYGGGTTIFGNASTATDIGAEANAVGLSGGAGNDSVVNQAGINVYATSDVYSDRSTFTFAGSADIDELLKSKSVATGIEGGAGDDQIDNSAYLDIDAFARAMTNGSAQAFLGGGSSASGKASTEAIAIGISGGAGNDVIENSAAIDVTANAAPETNNSSSAGVFFGGAQTHGKVVARLDTAGIDVGDGNNVVLNTATITANAYTDQVNYANETAYAYTYASGADFTFWIGGDDAYALSEARVYANADAIRGGDGNNTALNTGTLIVNVNPLASTKMEADGGGVGDSGRGDGQSNAYVTATGSGMKFGNGNNTLQNDGTIDVEVAPVARSTTRTDGRGSDSAAVWITSSAQAEGWGIQTGNGANQVVNNGGITVGVVPYTETRGHADGGGTSGNGTGFLNLYAFGTATGISLGDGDGVIENHALLSVTATPTVGAINNDVNMHAIGHIDGNAESYITTDAEGLAIGIVTGSGSHVVRNTDQITVIANTTAQNGYAVSPGGGDDGHADTTTSIYAQAFAHGIYLNSGDAYVENSGIITVAATPTTSLAVTVGDGGPFIMRESYGHAEGIRLNGDGAQTVVNSGTLSVTATGSINAVNDGPNIDPWPYRLGNGPTAYGMRISGAGEKVVVNDGTIDVDASEAGVILSSNPAFRVAAYGIDASDSTGSVTVVNNGTIDVTKASNAITSRGYAIRMGAGNDTIGLGASSVTNGDVDFGNGNATLILTGNPSVNGSIIKGGGDFNLVLNDTGSWNHSLPAVTRATKNGAGTFTMNALNSVSELTVNDSGSLRVSNNYTFAPNGLFLTGVYSDGTNGKFEATGTVRLDGTLRVERDGGLYTDGAQYQVVSAGTIQGGTAFEEIELPEATALVSFSSQQTANSVNVIANVEEFDSIAATGEQQAIAGALGNALANISTNPNSEFRQALIQLQSLSSANDVNAAYASMSPEAYNQLRGATDSGMRHYMSVLHDRMAQGQSGSDEASTDDEPMRVASGGDLTALFAAADERKRQSRGFWIRGFGQEGEQEANNSGTNAYDYRMAGATMGFDGIIADRYHLGASIGHVSSRVDADVDMSHGHIDNLLLSLYGGYYDGLYFLNGVVSGGTSKYNTARTVVVGPSTTQVESQHDGKVLSGSISAGFVAKYGNWRITPFASLQYTHLREDGFTESGGALALNVEERTTDAMISTFGASVARSIAGESGTWVPELSLARTHDHAIDDHTINASYVGAPDATFSIKDQPTERNGTSVGLGVSYYSNSGVTSVIKYNGDFRDGFDAHAVMGEVRFGF